MLAYLQIPKRAQLPQNYAVHKAVKLRADDHDTVTLQPTDPARRYSQGMTAPVCSQNAL